SDSVARVSRLLPRRISDRTNRSVKVLAIGTEDQAEEVALVHFFAEAFVGIIGKLIRLQIEDRDRLHGHGLLGSIAVVQQRGVAAVRADCDGGRKAVGAADVAGSGYR